MHRLIVTAPAPRKNAEDTGLQTGGRSKSTVSTDPACIQGQIGFDTCYGIVLPEVHLTC